MKLKRTAALFLAALLATLCFASCKTEPKIPGAVLPGKPSAALLTLYAGSAAASSSKPLRIITQQKGVTVTLQKLEYEPTTGFLRPVADEWTMALTPGEEYEIDKELAEGIPQYRLLVRQGENMALHNLCEDTLPKDREKDGSAVFEIRPWAPAPIDENSPMIHLCRAAVIAPKEDQYDYWYAISNAITTLRAVDLELPPDDEGVYAYSVPEWLFEAYALALFPDNELPSVTDWMWVGHSAGSGEPYLAYAAYSTWIWAEYKSSKQNPDGTWDVTMTFGTTDDDMTADEVVRLAPNKAWNPGSPFEYHIVGMPEAEAPEPGPPPPEGLAGTWKGPVRRGYSVRLEIYRNGTASLALVMDDDDFDMDVELYGGRVLAVQEGPDETVMEMEFLLEWHIYESGDGTAVTGVPDAFRGAYAFREAREDGGQVLYVAAKGGADPLFGAAELRLLWADMEPWGD